MPFKMPVPTKITSRLSSVTNAFANSIIPSVTPTAAEVNQALKILGMTRQTVCCAYCGDNHTEWDHLRPIIKDRKPTGYISEIGNLVPSCGKCNQSKGNKYWEDWMRSTSAKKSPASRKIRDIESRIKRLRNYENWCPRDPIDFPSIAGVSDWEMHTKNLADIERRLRSAQKHAEHLKEKIAKQFHGRLGR